MNFISYPVRHFVSLQSRKSLQYLSWNWSTLLASSPTVRRRCFHYSRRRLAAEGEREQDVADTTFWKEYRASRMFVPLLGFPSDVGIIVTAPTPTFGYEAQIPLSLIGSNVTAVGFLTRVSVLSESMCFAHISGGSVPKQVQVIFRGSELCEKLRGIRLNSTISVTGELAKKRDKASSLGDGQKKEPENGVLLKHIEIKAMEILCLNSVSSDLHVSKDHNYRPQSRHLQIRFDPELKKRLYFRAHTASWIRRGLELKDFQEVETPILFKSTPEGAREFLVPTRKSGYAYALPQSPQQYKQILMATGIEKYFQFAKCFRDEDLRADRQPEFTQVIVPDIFISST
jgi:aspartyl-tRNA synthetase